MQTHHALFRPTLALAFAAAFGCNPIAGQAQTVRDSGPGLRADSEQSTWPRWQTRLGVAIGRDDLSSAASAALLPAPAQSLSLFGDYYFLQQAAGADRSYGGGFRATGGVIVGQRSAAWASLPGSLSALNGGLSVQRRSFSLAAAPPGSSDGGSDGVPYLGLGYTGLKSLRATGGGWGFSADVGLIALQPRSVVRFGQQSLTELARDLQLSPLLQLGVSYSF